MPVATASSFSQDHKPLAQTTNISSADPLSDPLVAAPTDLALAPPPGAIFRSLPIDMSPPSSSLPRPPVGTHPSSQYNGPLPTVALLTVPKAHQVVMATSDTTLDAKQVVQWCRIRNRL